MFERIIPSSGEKIDVIGLGSWIQFDVSNDSPYREDLKKVLDLLGQGRRGLIDTSPMYGRSEETIGELCEQTGSPDQFFYATKVWTNGKDAGIRQMQASGLKMKRSVMDLIQIHNLVDWQTHLRTLRAWKEEGKVRYIGITHYTTASHGNLAAIIRKEPLDFVQFNYSIGTRDAEKTLLPLARDKGVAVIINEPLEKGRLFDRVGNRPLPGWAIESGINSWACFFLKYIIAHTAVTSVIPATSVPLHMQDNLSAGTGYVPEEAFRVKMGKYFNEEVD